jgi:cell wall-associated NlpC family hydrolase
MQTPPTLAARTMRLLAGAMVLAGAMSVAVAAPDQQADPVSRFLAEKGLVDANATPAEPSESDFVRQVRDKASDMVLTSMNFLGVPYRRGGTSAEDGFDCSGFTRRVFEMSLGLVLPRRADEQAKAKGLIDVKRDELKPGDLVFFNTLKRTFSHVGIYVGEGKFIHAPRTGGEVRVEDMRFAYWAKRFTGARRAEPVVADAAPAEPKATTPARAAR